MRPLFLLVFVAWFHRCFTYDFVIFSVVDINRMSLEEIIAASSKVLAVGVGSFSLPQFNVYVGAYSANNSDYPFTSLIQNYGYSKVLSSEDTLKVFEAQKLVSDEIVQSTVGGLGNLHVFLAKKNDLRTYQTIIISSPEAFESKLVRHKRVSSDVTFDEEPVIDENLAKQGNIRLQPSTKDASYSWLPVVLPHVDDANSLSKNVKCLLYLEAFDIIIPSEKSAHYLTVGSENNNSYAYNPLSKYYMCNMVDNRGYARFIIEVIVGNKIEENGERGIFSLPSKTVISIQLEFTGVQTNGYWHLSKTTLLNDIEIRRDNVPIIVHKGVALNVVDVGSVPRFSFVCSETQAAFFKTSNHSYPVVGIALRNFEVNLGLIGTEVKFGYYMTDCIGTFSAGTWMGIIVGLVLGGILLFGYLMVQSIQTMDRFDDPKQKQIMISFKE